MHVGYHAGSEAILLSRYQLKLTDMMGEADMISPS